MNGRSARFREVTEEEILAMEEKNRQIHGGSGGRLGTQLHGGRHLADGHTQPDAVNGLRARGPHGG